MDRGRLVTFGLVAHVCLANTRRHFANWPIFFSRKSQRQAEKILTAAKCHIDLEATTHARHAVEIGQAINFREYDAVAFVSGDGLPHEYLNGVKSRPDAAEVLEHLPIAQIGAGTSNALACNLTGPQHADDFAEACLCSFPSHHPFTPSPAVEN